MSILAIVETWEGNFKKASFEVVSVAKRIAGGDKVTALVMGTPNENASVLGKYGADDIRVISSSGINPLEMAYTLAGLIPAEASQIVLSHTNNGKVIAATLAVKTGLPLLTNVVSLPEGGTVKRKSFSSKGIAHASANEGRSILSIVPNAIGVVEIAGAGNVSDAQGSGSNAPAIKSINIDKAKGKIPLIEADIVISAGRGMKDPSNWGMVEEMAEILGAGTACSKPVSDMGWRPHSEHVGQTGIAINPKLYIAIGISGAIQHLAGVNSSKNIVVINKDPEAPFFKSADYGIVGDAFEVVPKLNEALRNFKANN
jgi:electron transfer flavoprotein alpha subunit